MRSFVVNGCVALALAAGAAGADAQPVRVECRDGRMSVTARDARLTEVLRAAATRCGFALVVTGTVERTVSLRIVERPVGEALRRLLEEQDHVIEQPAASEGRPVPTVRLVGTGPMTVERTEAGPALPAPGAPPPANLEALAAALRSADAEVREEAVDALAQTGHPEAAAVLAVALADPDEDVRDAAFMAMSDLGGPGAVSALAGALGDARAGVRVAAVEALAAFEQPDLARHLVPALADADEEVREAAFSALSAMEGQAVTDALGAVLGDARPDVRLAAVEGLADIDGPQAAALLRKALADADETVRRAAGEALESR